MFIVWGTKVRLRDKGSRADFCQECLLVTRTKVSAVETVGHLYYIPLGFYKEQHRIGECDACGCITQTAPAASVASPQGLTLDMDEFVRSTNPLLSEQLPRLAEELASTLTEEARTHFVLENFCCRAKLLFSETATNTGGLLGVLVILAALPVAIAFLVSVPMGWGAIVISLLAIAWIRNVVINRKVRKVLSKRLSILLPSSGIRWNQLEAHVLESGKTHRQLAKHLAHHTYHRLSLQLSRVSFSEQASMPIIRFSKAA